MANKQINDMQTSQSNKIFETMLKRDPKKAQHSTSKRENP